VGPIAAWAVKDRGDHAESTGVSAGNACPQCGAAARPEAAWCALCFAKLAGGFDPLTAPIEEVLGQSEGTTKTVIPPVVHEPIETYVSEVSRHVEDPVTTAEVAIGPSTSASDVNQAVAGEDLTEVDVMLALLAAEHRQDDPTAAWADRFGDKGVRMVIIMGGTAAVAAICFVVLTVFGALT
jgi:hypothetical protein